MSDFLPPHKLTKVWSIFSPGLNFREFSMKTTLQRRGSLLLLTYHMKYYMYVLSDNNTDIDFFAL